MGTISTNESGERLPAFLQWTPIGRAITFFLAATSIWCLLSEMYHLCEMRTFTFFVLIPATALLAVMAIVNRKYGDRLLWRAVVIGTIGGFIAACAYDIFRLPWVIGAIDHIGPLWLRLPLFKVFPRFGALILGMHQKDFQNYTDSQFTLTAHVIGWLYHFSNGMTFGVMYLAIIGSARRRTWVWAIALAVALEILMLVSPYAGFFSIQITALFIAVTLTAHTIFGVALGLYAKWAERRWVLETA